MPTKIEWTNETWNPITGCTKISEGCTNCYAERMAKRLAGRYGYPEQPHHFEVTVHEDKFDQPLKWKKPRMIFVCSMGDLFHPDVPHAEIKKILDVIKKCPQHTFQILTKRPEAMFYYFQANHTIYDSESYLNKYELFRNLWLGVTAENQKTADERIPWLLKTPAVVRFVSVEPMLGSVDLQKVVMPDGDYLTKHFRWQVVNSLDWVICGGETGHGAREMKAEWAQDLYVQCRDAGVPFFFKKPGDAFKGNKDDLPLVREYPGI